MFRKPPKHEHDYDVRGVYQNTLFSQGKYEADGKTEKLPSGRETHVLWACAGCHERFVQTLTGFWTVAQLERRRPPAKGFETPWEAGIETR
jgi:hypothetical protein